MMMKKTNLFPIIGLVVLCLFGLTFASCSKDSDDSGYYETETEPDAGTDDEDDSEPSVTVTLAGALVGSWSTENPAGSNDGIIFNADGTGKFAHGYDYELGALSVYDFSYSVDEDSHTVTCMKADSSVTYAQVEVGDDTLRLKYSSGEAASFVRRSFTINEKKDPLDLLEDRKKIPEVIKRSPRAYGFTEKEVYLAPIKRNSESYTAAYVIPQIIWTNGEGFFIPTNEEYGYYYTTQMGYSETSLKTCDGIVDIPEGKLHGCLYIYTNYFYHIFEKFDYELRKLDFNGFDNGAWTINSRRVIFTTEEGYRYSCSSSIDIYYDSFSLDQVSVSTSASWLTLSKKYVSAYRGGSNYTTRVRLLFDAAMNYGAKRTAYVYVTVTAADGKVYKTTYTVNQKSYDDWVEPGGGGSGGGSDGSSGGGSGKTKCSNCYGTGKCAATGCINGKCARCGGTGKAPGGGTCHYCNYGTCRTCGGSGKCKYCGGDGYI